MPPSPGRSMARLGMGIKTMEKLGFLAWKIDENCIQYP